MGFKINGSVIIPDEVHLTDWLTQEHEFNAVRLDNKYIWYKPLSSKLNVEVNLTYVRSDGTYGTATPSDYSLVLERNRSKQPGATTGEISLDSTLYPGDELSLTISIPNGYFASLTVDGETVPNILQAKEYTISSIQPEYDSTVSIEGGILILI